MSELEILGTHRKIIAQALNEAVMYLHAEAEDVKTDPQYSDLEDMYKRDAADYEGILACFLAGAYKAAANAYWSMDTASRDNLFKFIPAGLDPELDQSIERFLNL